MMLELSAAQISALYGMRKSAAKLMLAADEQSTGAVWVMAPDGREWHMDARGGVYRLVDETKIRERYRALERFDNG